MEMDNPIANRILRVLGATEDGRMARRKLAQKLRDLGVATDYYGRAAALQRLEAAGRIRRETRGHDSRGFRKEMVELVW